MLNLSKNALFALINPYSAMFSLTGSLLMNFAFTEIKNYKDYDLSNYLINSYGQIKPIDNGKGNKIHAGKLVLGYKIMTLTENKTKQENQMKDNPRPAI